MARCVKRLLILACLFAGQMAHAEQIAAGKVKAQLCDVCHRSASLNLKGFDEQYLLEALKRKQARAVAYYEQGRFTLFMPSLARLSDEDIASLAAYYASYR